MVESSKEKFTGLNLDEISSKISSFTNSEKTIRIWSRDEEPSLAFVRGYSRPSLTLDASRSLNEIEVSKKIFINFSFNGVDYFAKGVVESSNNGIVELKLDETVFKSEKRLSERLLTFPHHQVYSYFKVFSEKEQSNIISLNKVKNEKEEVLESFATQRMKEILNDDAVSDLMGFRIMDLSSTGLSFLANNRETSYFASFSENSSIEFTLMFNGVAYTLNCAEIIYIVDFVNSRASRVPMKKIGIQFNENENLKEQIMGLINEKGALREVDKSFETFLAE
ncbi:hypothetical protein [Halobacteriovorax sp. HLS]|uniref:hypothetical protein n=1 Tax=Halobacteriovorax sp. HLS TaxID=2234000 RepID=UPI000FD80197|nr:hypothetical protein [Halobacteriovorax sp. HLS]